jgi:hypothetical protein
LRMRLPNRVDRKVLAMLGDHNAVAKTTALVFLLEAEQR